MPISRNLRQSAPLLGHTNAAQLHNSAALPAAAPPRDHRRSTAPMLTPGTTLHRCQTVPDGALRAAAIALLQARRAGRVNDDDEEAVLNAAKHSGISAAAAAIAARDCALAGLTSDELFARLAAIVSRRCGEAPAAARAQCGLAALRLRKRTWRRLGGKVTFSDDAALAELWDYSKSRKKVTQTPSARGGFALAAGLRGPVEAAGRRRGVRLRRPRGLARKARPHVNVLAVDRAAHCLLYGTVSRTAWG